MSDTTPTNVTSSAQSVSATDVAEAIERTPDKWIQENEQVIATHPVGDTTAKEIRQAFKNKQFPDGTPLSNVSGFISNQDVRDAFSDYLKNPDDWQVRDRQRINPWLAIYADYKDPEVNISKARQRAVNQLKEDLCIKPIKGTDELVWYDDEKGVYENDAERIVKERLEAKLREYNAPKEANHLLHKLNSQPSVEEDEFTPEGKICVSNGVLDISDPSNLELDRHRPEYRFREQLPVEYDPDADAPQFRQFISNRVAERDVAKLQEFVGYVVSRPWDMRYHKALIIVGPTQTGKSTFLKVLTALLGKENISNLSLQQLVDDQFALGQAQGKFANICNDLDAKKVNNIGQFKQLTAGDRLEVDKKYDDYQTIQWTQKQVYAANQVPELEYEDNAFYRRWLHVRFPNEIPEDRQSGQFEDELKAELSGILNWALKGYARLMRNECFTGEMGLEEKRDLWKEYGNSIDCFVDDRAEAAANVELPKDEVYSAYKTFCAETGRQAKPRNSFSDYLTQEYNVGTTRPTVDGERQRCYRGLYLPDADEDEAPQQDSPTWSV